MWSTAASWLALIAFAAAVIKYYNPQLFDRLQPPQQNPATPRLDPTQRPSVKKQKSKRTLASRSEANNFDASTPASANGGTGSKRRKLGSEPVHAPPAPGRDDQAPRDDSGGMSNRDFAQQLAKAQAGTKLEPSKKATPSKKERRAARRALHAPPPDPELPGLSAEASSATSRDADDDLSLAGSPSSGPVSTAPTWTAALVSDMLEAPTPKPTTLRLTDVKDVNNKGAPPKASKAFEPVRTKKQRQRQAKQAEQKALREEADRIHEAKKQAQLRTARMAGGTSNQTKADAFVTRQQNPWQGRKPAPDSPVSPAVNEVPPLLDTIDLSGAVGAEPSSNLIDQPQRSRNGHVLPHTMGEGKTGASKDSSREESSREQPAPPQRANEIRSSWADQVNEEEENNWADQLTQEGQWESVTNKKSKKKTRKETLNDTSSEASSSLVRPTPHTPKPGINGTRTNGITSENLNVGRFQSIEQTTGFKDAEWEA